jgi:hypothetical protein
MEIDRRRGGSIMLWRLVQFALMAMVTLLVGTSVSTAQSVGDDDAVKQFLQSVDEYMTLRRHLELRLPPLEVSDDAQRIDGAVEARADEIRRVRAGARTGDIFNGGAGDVFRSRIEQAIATSPCNVAALSRETHEHGERWRRAVVNDRFIWRTAAPTPPCVLAVLPALPRELQYRFVGPDLVLVDIDVRLILDVLANVLDLSAVHPSPLPALGDR